MKICLEHFKKVEVCTVPRFDWEFGGQNKTEFEAFFRFVICPKVSGQFRPNIIGQKRTCPFYFQIVKPISPEIDEKTTHVSGEIVNEKRKECFMSFAAK